MAEAADATGTQSTQRVGVPVLGRLWDAIEDRVQDELERPVFRRDPEFIERALPAMERAIAYFDPELRGFDRLPGHGPFLLVGSHSGGIYMPDLYVVFTEWYRRRGLDDPMYALVYDFAFEIPGFGGFLRRLGGLPASHRNADAALARGSPVAVFPGGDHEAYRPWTQRNRVDLAGHQGFVRLALRHRIPVVPMVSHGSHESIIVLARNGRLAHALGLDRLRIHVLPVLLAIPWGPAFVLTPTIPLPTRITVQICEPFDWSALPPGAEDDAEQVRHCYEAVLGRMQTTLDELVDEEPNPLLGRLRPRRRSAT